MLAVRAPPHVVSALDQVCGATGSTRSVVLLRALLEHLSLHPLLGAEPSQYGQLWDAYLRYRTAADTATAAWEATPRAPAAAWRSARAAARTARAQAAHAYRAWQTAQTPPLPPGG